MSGIQQLTSAFVRPFQAVYTSLTDGSPLLPFIPKPLKIIFLLLIILNSPSLPFQWHLRVWKTPLRAYWDLYTKGRKKYLSDWSVVNKKEGGVRMVTKTKRLAWVDDCDYNVHLSNSAYAKNVDAARMDWCIIALSPLFTPKTHAALGASHYVFFKEIPLGMEYTMESRCGGWGDKWFYLITEFVIYPKGKGKGRNKSQTQNRSSSSLSTSSSGLEGKEVKRRLEVRDVSEGNGSAGDSISELPIPNLSLSGLTSSSESSSGVVTPEKDSGLNTPMSKVITGESVKANATYKAREVREDGGVVCCLAVSEYVFKMGRVTVPPRIALYLGFQSPTEKGRAHAESIIMNHPDKGKAWLRGGWKDEPDADSLGRDIGLDAGGNGEWIEKGRDGMGKVIEGLSTF